MQNLYLKANNYIIKMPNLLSNPQAFKIKCDDVGVTYDLLMEAQQCLGKQGCSKLFSGK